MAIGEELLIAYGIQIGLRGRPEKGEYGGPLSPAYVRHVADAIFTPGPVRDFVKSTFADGEG